jgi:hypothetical protein
LLGHADVSTTMIYTHVLNKPGIALCAHFPAGDAFTLFNMTGGAVEPAALAGEGKEVFGGAVIASHPRKSP